MEDSIQKRTTLPPKEKKHPVAVLISDIHYSLSTLDLADSAMRQAIDKAAELRLPLIDCGDLTNDKAILRAECVNILISTMIYAESKGVAVKVLVGNHSLINEKGKEHALEFLRPYVEIIDTPRELDGFYFIPYQSDTEEFKRVIQRIPPGETIIMHQGVTGSESGEYVYDKSAIDKDLLAPYRVISGHYHKSQDIKCGRPQKGAIGLMSYIGSPYSITFAEANDGPKGFQVLYSDGLLEQIPTNLRKHVIYDIPLTPGSEAVPLTHASGDLIWVKLRGSYLSLEAVKKSDIADRLHIDNCNFKLDKIPTDGPALSQKDISKKSNSEVFDLLIDQSDESAAKKVELKALWRSL